MEKREINIKENYNLLVAKKTEKMVTAIYLVSQFLSDKENLKFDLRKEANLLLKNVNSIAFVNDKNFEESSKNIFVIYKLSLDSLSLIISYLFVAKDSNLISRMNVDIVIDGLRILENILIKKQFNFNEIDTLIQEENELRENLFDINKSFKSLNTSFDAITERNKYTEATSNTNFENLIKKSVNNLNDNKNEIKDNPEDQDFIINDKYKRQNEDIKDNIIFNKNKDTKVYYPKNTNQESKDNLKDFKKVDIDTIKKPRKSENRKQNRRDQILALFTKGVEVSIHDISKKVVGCSVKTLQRELNALVISKNIDRIGDKRWSRYILL